MELRFDCGVQAELCYLQQGREYAGQLEGLPTRESNALLIRHAVRTAKAQFGEVVLVEAEQTPINYPGDYPFGTPARLPAIGCVGHFKGPPTLPKVGQPGSRPSWWRSAWRSLVSSPGSRVDEELEADYATLTLLWWQGDFGLPTEEAVLASLRAVDWLTQSKNCIH